MKINVYCKNRGWLFEDLKREIAQFGAIPSDEPLKDADAWICIRDTEAYLSPDKKRTLVTVHHTEQIRHCGYGMLSFVHPHPAKQWREWNKDDKFFTLPIGSREIPHSPLPDKPVLGYFCREHGKGLKRSKMFAEAVESARTKVVFDVLMIGEKLEHIAHIGRYERRAAVPEDYGRISAFCTTSVSPMVPLSAYEALAAGRPVITTKRYFPHPMIKNIHVGDTVEELSDKIVSVIKNPKLQAQKVFKRSDWCKTMVLEAKKLCSQK